MNRNLSPWRANQSRWPAALAALFSLALAAGPVSAAEQPAGAGAGAVTMTVNEAERGTLLLRDSQSGALKPAPTVDTSVKMVINGLIGRVTVSQSFTHPGSDFANGIYVFPLPEQSAVDRLRMRIGERIIEGEIKAKAAARAAFTAARDAGKKATLVEQQRPNLFTSSVANIGPGETVTVEIEYQQTLDYDSGWFELRFPMTVGVRYIAGQAPVRGFDGGGWSMNTDQVPDASGITPPMTAAGAGHSNPVSMDITLHAGMPLADLESSYHPVQHTDLGENRHHIELREQDVPADRDFVLRFRPKASHTPRAAFFKQEVDGESYGLLMLMPPEAEWSRQQALAREVVFVVDTSGSMHGTSMEQARAALLDGLERLRPTDTFNLIQFNSITQQLAPTPLAANATNLELARRYVGQLRADGGTEMRTALRAVLDGQSRSERLRQVIFITDAAVGNEQALLELIESRLGSARLFPVGIGSAPNAYFMREAAHLGRGTFTYIGDLSEVRSRINGLFQKLEFPVLSDIRIEGGPGDLEVWPTPLRDLYVQEPIVANLRLHGQDSIVLTGVLAGQPWSTQVPVANGGKASGLDVAWARQKIASLERSLARGADRSEVRNQITELGLSHHMVTAHTSLVAIDRTPTRPASAKARDAQVPAKMPAGWAMSTPTPRLPQTASPLYLHLLMALGLSVMGWLVRRRGQGS